MDPPSEEELKLMTPGDEWHDWVRRNKAEIESRKNLYTFKNGKIYSKETGEVLSHDGWFRVTAPEGSEVTSASASIGHAQLHEGHARSVRVVFH